VAGSDSADIKDGDLAGYAESYLESGGWLRMKYRSLRIN